jgi:hypothetical protein
MKKLSLLLLSVTLCLFSACHDDIWNAIDGLDARVAKLEELCKEMNTNITSLQTIVDVLQSNDYITSIVEIEKNGEVVGYTITFGKHDPITIYHGQDGKNGQDGKDGDTPVIGVAQDTDGVYYWTLNGEWFLDDNGNKINCGTTPLLKIEEGYWYVSYNNGNTWEKIDDTGAFMFQSVTQDENYVYFSLADGTVIKVKKENDSQPNSEFIFTLTYDPNGGKGVMEKDVFYYGCAGKISSCTYQKEGCDFVSWNSKADGTGATYYSGSSIILDKNIILYAQWKKATYYFSVSDTTKVAFAPGNLQYHPANNKWRFAPSQLDYIGEANKYVSTSYNGWLDLFGWSTSATKFGVSASMDWENAFLGDFVDWGKNKIGNDAPNTWRTLTYEEWSHILAFRPKASSLYGLAQVNGVKGLVLLPDNWTCPSGVSLKLNINSFFEMTTDQWSQLEAAGAIWLPLAGNRWGTDLYDVQNIGVYWTSTEWSINQAIYVQFTIDETVLCYFSGRADGRSIRLVKDL